MNFSFFNPFSDRFLQVEPEHSQMRANDAALNSFGVGEDPSKWKQLVRGYGTGYTDPIDPYDSNSILFETVFANKRQRINFYRSMRMLPFCQKMFNYDGR